MRNINLRTKLSGLLAVLIAIYSCANISYSIFSQRNETEAELVEIADTLKEEMQSTWDFMATNQDKLEQIAFNEIGGYQGLHCAIAGRSIARLFTTRTDYTIRFVNFNPRNIEDTPDSFETEALNAFHADTNLKRYYELSANDDAQVFRYCAPMEIADNCLECHGDPAGEIDISGHAKEGWKIGDVGGAISIAIPADVFLVNERNDIISGVAFTIFLFIAASATIFFAISRLVTRPLNAIEEGLDEIRKGDLSVSLPPLRTRDNSRELENLIVGVNRMAADLKTTYDNLEEMVADRTAMLSEANEGLLNLSVRLQKENQYKTEFLSMMSHELRTPLTSIIAYTEMLLKRDDALDQRAIDICASIQSSSHQLLLMVNDILEMSRLEAGRTKIVFDTVDLGDVVGIVKSVVVPLATRKGIVFKSKVSSNTPLIKGDFEMIRHALENVCGNAVKFTAEGGEVSLLIHPATECDAVPRPDVDWVAIEVKDNGIGIAAEDQEKIFERFMQADGRISRQYRGTGLGLTLANEYVEMHHGKITVESEPGRGSVFTLLLPVSQSYRTEGSQSDDT